MSYSRNIKNAAIGLAMATGLTCSYIEPAKADGLGDTTFVVSTNSGRLNVRQKPSTNAKVVGKLKKGSRVVVTDINGNKWGKVGKGWVSMQYLKALNNPVYDSVVEQENQAEANLFRDEKKAHAYWLKNQKAKYATVTKTTIAYEHGSDLYRPLFKMQKGAKVKVYYKLAVSPYAFIEYQNVDGNSYSGFVSLENIK